MLEELKKAYEKLDVRCVEEDDPAYLTCEQNEARAEFFIRAYAAMPALLEAAKFIGVISRLMQASEWDDELEMQFNPTQEDLAASMNDLIITARTIKEYLK